jgi:hypothetical protein
MHARHVHQRLSCGRSIQSLDAKGTTWRITINDGPTHPQQTVTVRVQDDKARSCMSGDWKRLERVSGSYDGLSEPAYTLSGNHLTILLASDICDGYDQLDGKLEHGRFSARHSVFGIQGGDDLGQAVAVQVR